MITCRPGHGRWMLALSCCLAALATSCNYRLIDPSVGAGRILLVPTTVNDTRWRGVEVDATRSLRNNLERQLDVELTSSKAYNYLVRSKIIEIRRSAAFSNRQGGFTLGTGLVRLEWAVEGPDGQQQLHGQISRDLEFLTNANETNYTAISEILEEMAEQIVMEIAADWASTSETQR
jgi:lipopolysaccharide assembly LptE-like protein